MRRKVVRNRVLVFEAGAREELTKLGEFEEAIAGSLMRIIRRRNKLVEQTREHEVIRGGRRGGRIVATCVAWLFIDEMLSILGRGW